MLLGSLSRCLQRRAALAAAASQLNRPLFPLSSSTPLPLPSAQVNVELNEELGELGRGMGVEHLVRPPRCHTPLLPRGGATRGVPSSTGPPPRLPQPPSVSTAARPHPALPPSPQPWFHLFLGGELQSSFSANVTTVGSLRSEIAALKRCDAAGCAEDWPQ